MRGILFPSFKQQVSLSRGGQQSYAHANSSVLGSILTNLLLCLGLCFFVAGVRRHTQNQKFHAVVSEAGTGLLLVAAFGLLIPSAFYSALKTETVSLLQEKFTQGKLQEDILEISRGTSIVLMVAFVLYLVYSCTSAHSILDEVIEMDEHADADREQDSAKMKLTLTETFVALVLSIVFVAWLLVILVGQIEEVVESGVPDQFLGLILRTYWHHDMKLCTYTLQYHSSRKRQSILRQSMKPGMVSSMLPYITALVHPFRQLYSMLPWSSLSAGHLENLWILILRFL